MFLNSTKTSEGKESHSSIASSWRRRRGPCSNAPVNFPLTPKLDLRLGLRAHCLLDREKNIGMNTRCAPSSASLQDSEICCFPTTEAVYLALLTSTTPPRSVPFAVPAYPRFVRSGVQYLAETGGGPLSTFQRPPVSITAPVQAPRWRPSIPPLTVLIPT